MRSFRLWQVKCTVSQISHLLASPSGELSGSLWQWEWGRKGLHTEFSGYSLAGLCLALVCSLALGLLSSGWVYLILLRGFRQVSDLLSLTCAMLEEATWWAAPRSWQSLPGWMGKCVIALQSSWSSPWPLQHTPASGALASLSASPASLSSSSHHLPK